MTLLTKPSSVHNFEVKSKELVMRVHAVPGGAGNVRHNVAFFAKDGVDEGRLAHIGLSDNGQLGQSQLFLLRLLGHGRHNCIQQIARSVAIVG